MNYDYVRAPKAITPCPLCGQSSFEPLASIDRYNMGIATVGCRSCGLIQTNPRLTTEALNEFYRRSYREFYERVIQPSENYVRANLKDVRLTESVAFMRHRELVRDTGVVLDVGCSEGALFAALRKSGFSGTLVGVEPNTEFRAYTASIHGANVYPTEFDLPEALQGKIDLAVINHVLEHLIDPVATLARLRQFIQPGGHLYVDVPNAERYRSVNDLHIAHIYHFTMSSLRSTLSAAGFDLVDIEAYLPINHPPSLRAIARPRAQHRQPVPADAAAAQMNQTCWKQVVRINRQRHRLALRRFLRQSSTLMYLYRKFRGVVGVQDQP